jgi:hypothetical protein
MDSGIASRVTLGHRRRTSVDMFRSQSGQDVGGDACLASTGR